MTHKRLYMLKAIFIDGVLYPQDAFCSPRKERANFLIAGKYALNVTNDDRGRKEIKEDHDKKIKKEKQRELKSNFPLMVFK